MTSWETRRADKCFKEPGKREQDIIGERYDKCYKWKIRKVTYKTMCHMVCFEKETQTN